MVLSTIKLLIETIISEQKLSDSKGSGQFEVQK